MEKEIDTIELIDLMNKKDINLIDIRDNYIYSKGTIKGAINIPMNFLIINPSQYLKTNEKYYIFCSHGSNSKRICSYLTRNGYNVVNIIGGYYSYLEDSV